MNFGLDADIEAFREEIRAFLDEELDPVIANQGPFPQADTPEKAAFIKKLADRGYLGLTWPEEYGGRGLDEMYQLVFQSELEYLNMPTLSIEVGMLGQTILRNGSQQLKRELLPKIVRGELSMALGYSEPEAGSDLAALQTAAVLDGERFVVNGQKMFTSAAHFADVVWLACRTDFEVPKHKGISLLVVDMDSPGVETTPIYTMGDHQTNMVFFTDVEVPKGRLVGELNEAWKYIGEALDYERLLGLAFEGLQRDVDELLAWARTDDDRWNDPAIRRLVTRATVAIEGVRTHLTRAPTAGPPSRGADDRGDDAQAGDERGPSEVGRRRDRRSRPGGPAVTRVGGRADARPFRAQLESRSHHDDRRRRQRDPAQHPRASPSPPPRKLTPHRSDVDPRDKEQRFPMKFSLFYFPQVGMGDPHSYERKLIGNEPDQFQYLLEDLKLHAQFVKSQGFHGVYFAEHHFDTEGFEMCPNPLMLDQWVGMHTERLHIGAMGLALPCWNPLRLAEDIAVMSHMWGDRFELGFVRGVFGREVAPLAAAHQVTGGISDQSESDQRNRRLFVENYQVLMEGLTKGLFHYDGEFHKIPPDGLVWDNPATKKYGGGIAPDGTVTDIGVVPKLKDGKMPLRWQCFTASEETMRFAGREGMNLALTAWDPEMQRRFQEAYREEAAGAGRPLEYGERVCYVRGMFCHEDGDRARAIDELAVNKIWGEKFIGNSIIGFIRPDIDDPATFKYSYEMLLDRDFIYAGNPDEISRSIERLLEQTNCEYLALQINTGAVPRDLLMHSLELFTEKVMPRFDVEPAPTNS